MATFMDISEDNNGRVMSIVVGCDVDGSRQVHTDLYSANTWAKNHECPAVLRKPKSPEVPRTQFLKLMGTKELSTAEVSKATGVTNVHSRLATLLKAGLVTKRNSGIRCYWTVVSKDTA